MPIAGRGGAAAAPAAVSSRQRTSAVVMTLSSTDQRSRSCGTHPSCVFVVVASAILAHTRDARRVERVLQVPLVLPHIVERHPRAAAQAAHWAPAAANVR
eukprot:Amastigsp_a683278_32.p2 type:complete len:100 gc:universal Amastigsp_a683278_32:576-277(-)